MTPEQRASAIVMPLGLNGHWAAEVQVARKTIASAIRAAVAERQTELVKIVEVQMADLNREAEAMTVDGDYREASRIGYGVTTCQNILAAIRQRSKP